MKITLCKSRAAIFFAFYAIALGLVANAESATCQHSDGMWGDVDPNIFYICDAATNTPQQLRCPEGRGFFNGLGYHGCLPFAEWPACINNSNSDGSSISGGDGTMHICDAEQLMQPWESSDPNKFYMCLAEAAAPLLVNCEAGRGFVNAIAMGGSGSSRILGCAKWEQWRDYMQCSDFY